MCARIVLTTKVCIGFLLNIHDHGAEYKYEEQSWPRSSRLKARDNKNCYKIYNVMKYSITQAVVKKEGSI